MPQDRPLQGRRILIAEDSAIQALDLKTLLEQAGAEVFGPAKTVAEVFALANPAAFDCAVLDVILRKERVLPAAQALKERGVAIVFCTGSADLGDLSAEWPNAGVLSKPVSSERLLEAVRAACEGGAVLRTE